MEMTSICQSCATIFQQQISIYWVLRSIITQMEERALWLRVGQKLWWGYLPHQSPTHPQYHIVMLIDLNPTNFPLAHNVACIDHGREPRLWSELAKHQLDFKDSWKEVQKSLSQHLLGFVWPWISAQEEFKFDFKVMQSMCCMCIGKDANTKLIEAPEGAIVTSLEAWCFYEKSTGVDGWAQSNW